MTDPTSQAWNDGVLVRVAPELLEYLATTDSEPVVIVGIDRQEDGTYDMVLRSVRVENLKAPADARQKCIELAKDIVQGELLNRKGFEAWWDAIDDDVQDEIVNDIADLIEERVTLADAELTQKREGDDA